VAAVRAWARSELRRGFLGTVALVLLVGLSTAVAATAVAGARRTHSAFDRFLESSAAATHRLQYTSDADVDGEVLDRLRSHPDVEQAVPLWFTVAFSEATDYDIGVFHSSDPALLRDIDRPRLLEGRLPAPDADDEVVINEFLRRQTGIGVGGTISLITFSQEQLEEDRFDEEPGGPLLDLTVVGVGRLPDDVADEEASFLLAGPGYYERTAGEAGAFGPSFELIVRNGADAAAVVDEALAGLPVEEPELEGVEARTDRVRDATRVLEIGLLLFGACAALAGIVACGQAISRRLASLAVDQGPLQAMGLTRAQRVGGVLHVAAPTALAGALLGVALSVAASPLMPLGVARRAEPSPGIDVDWTVLAAAVAVAVVALLATAALAAWRVTAPSATTAAVVVQPARLRRSVAARTAARTGRSPAAVLGMSMALEAGRGRTAVPVRPALVGAVAGIAGVVAALTFGASLDRLVTTPSAYGWNWAISPDLFGDDAETVAALPEVKDVGVLLFRQTSVDGEPVEGIAVHAVAGAPSLTVLDGRMPNSVGEVALGPKTAEELDKGIGDTMRVDTNDGEAVEVTVVGEVLFPVFDENPFNEGLAFHPDLAVDVQQSDGFGAAMVDFRPGVTDDEGTAAVREVLPESLTVYSFPSQPGDVANLEQVSAVPLALAAFLVVVALAAVAHALVTSVRRRRRDLGVVRSIGFRGRDVLMSVGIQASTIIVIGLLVGAPLGVAVGRSAWSLVADQLGVGTSPSIPALALVALVPAALVAAVVLALLPGRAATRVSPAVALRAE
jgi:ABC-type lipoprotein release transport system permease subunit